MRNLVANLFERQELVFACLLLPMSLAFLRCDTDDGLAEQAGAKIDKASEDIKSAAEDVPQTTGEGVEREPAPLV